MSFDFINNNNVPYNAYGLPNPYSSQMNAIPQQQVNYQQPMMQQQMVDPRIYDTPEIVTSGPKVKFTITDTDDKNLIPVDRDIPDMEKEAKKRVRASSKTESGGTLVRPSVEKVQGELVGTDELPTSYTYMETTGMLRETLGQIDTLNAELMQEFNAVKHNRTMKNKYNVLVGLSENVGSLISNKISAIREINSSISKANEMDFKKDKDRRAATAAMDDDKYIADLYKSFMSNAGNLPAMPQVSPIDSTVFGSGIVRAELKSGDYNSNGVVDVGYLNYMSNLSPEQNMMRYENNPNVKQVVVFDAATGNKFFQVMDISTGNVIPNVPVYDQMFMEDTTLDLKTKIAKNINLGETFPIIVLNEGVTSEY